MIIGVTGYLGAGKDTLADYLVKKGFTHLSLSDILRGEIKSRKQEVTREALQELGNDLRERFGPGALAALALLSLEEGKDYVISSIGTAGEVLELKKKPGFTLVFVDAPQKVRFERIRRRAREQDPKDWKSFQEHETKESRGGGANYRSFEETKMLADIIVLNDKTSTELHAKVDRMLYDIKTRRPSWDEYFLGIMNAVRQRGTCDRGKTGAVIVKDNRILTTGYVGSVIGMPHCDEVGHLMSEVINEDGTTSKHCVRTVHAEQNAIAQAARNGIKIDGATLYCYMEPCFVCAKMTINAGIKRVVAAKAYHRSKLSRAFFKAAGVELVIMDDAIENYKDASSQKK